MSTTATAKANSKAAPTTTIAPAAEPSLLDRAIEATVERLDALSRQVCTELADVGLSALKRSLKVAAARKQLEEALSPEVLRLATQLMNQPEGFMTDRGPQNPKQSAPYDLSVVRACLVSALLAGLSWHDNEFNIISSRLYVTLNGYWRKVKEFPGLTDLELIPGTPQQANGHTVVRVGARWKLHGRADELADARGEPGVVFPVTVNQYSTADNVIGKAKRKALKMVFERISGVRQGEDDDETPLLDQAVARTRSRSRTAETAEALAQKAGRKVDEQNQAAEAPSDDQLHRQAPDKEAEAGTSDPEPTAEEMASWGGPNGGKGPYADGR